MKKKKIDYGEHNDNIEMYPNISNTASANECTGLMPTPPQNAYEEAAYQDLFSTEIPQKLPSKKEIKNGVYDDIPPEILN